jgi:parallel beta-helix repeat protein
LSQGNWGQILGNTCSKNGQLVTGGAGVGVLNCAYSIVANNNCISNGTGSYFTHGIQLNTTNNCVINGNFSQGNTGSGIDIHISAYTTCTGNQSVGNIVRGIEDDTTSTYSTIDGNVVYGNYEIGISVFNTIGSIVSNNSISNNGLLGTATNPSTGVANQPYGLALWGAGSYGNYTLVTNNNIVQNIGTGSNGVGMWVDSACVSVSLLGNSFSANTTQIVSTKANFFVVKDNYGVVTQQTGTTTLASGSTSVAVTFSPALAYAPTASSIVATFLNLPTNNTGPIAITGVSASGFTINTYAAPGGSGVGIDWSVSVFA